MMKFYKGKEYEITGTRKFDDLYYEYIGDDGDFQYMPSSFFSDTKEESLEKWSPYKLDEINIFHKIKFGSLEKETQIKKLYEEVIELKEALEKGDLSSIKDELGDVIQSSAGVFLLRDVMTDNFKKLSHRVYPDNYKHKV